jgi:hypothetical protein
VRRIIREPSAAGGDDDDALVHRSTYLGDDVDVVYDDEPAEDDELDDWFQRNITAGEWSISL